MEQFSALRLFISVGDTGSFSAAAELLGVSTSVVSRGIAALEAELGIRLLKRSTRRVALTEAGSLYLTRVRSLLTELEDTNKSLKQPNTPATGRFRIAAPTALGLALIAPAVADFMAGQPNVVIQLDLLDRAIDLLEEDYDVALRVDETLESMPNLRSLGQLEVGLFSSPAYLARHGRPHGPADLGKHRALYPASQQSWNLRGGLGEMPRTQFCSNRLEALKTLCLTGQGIALLPLFLVRGETERNELVQLLDGFEPKPLNLVLATSLQRSETNSSRLFQRFLEARFKRLRL
ncbi:MAG: LysR family transcriptional regulator [Aestuariivirga sp.]|nr:LysR family transcriptional regulator [Aestuariivirga sp.]